MKHMDLFSGIGGFALAAKWAGFETTSFCEIDPFCRKVLHKHWPGVLKYKDIRDIANPDHVDLLTGGFPCQPFSVAGKQKGIKDDRYLWPEMLRIIRLCRPTWVIAENVPGIIPHLDPILESLEEQGYYWRAYLIPASTTGAPHKRERLWIIANTHSNRCESGSDHRQKRYVQADIDRHLKTLYAEWQQFIPESWKAFNAQDWLVSSPNSNSSECVEGKTDNATFTQRSEWPQPTAEIVTHDSRFNWQKDQPPVPGMDDGLSERLDRNKSLGNAIVPQVIYPMMKLIYEIEIEYVNHVEDL